MVTVYNVRSLIYFITWNVLELTRIGQLLAKAASVRLKALADKCRSIPDYVELISSFRFGLYSFVLHIQSIQINDELSQLAGLASNLKPKTVLEIGTAQGGTFFLWSRIASPDALLLSIDLRGSFRDPYPKWKTRSTLFRSFGRNSQKVYLINAKSQDPSTASQVSQILGERKLDFLFIDGDHSYQGVKKDYEMYSPLVRKGGVIAFHDIVPGLRKVGGVPEFWREVSETYRHFEIVRSWQQKGFGIGVLFP